MDHICLAASVVVQAIIYNYLAIIGYSLEPSTELNATATVTRSPLFEFEWPRGSRPRDGALNKVSVVSFVAGFPGYKYSK